MKLVSLEFRFLMLPSYGRHAGNKKYSEKVLTYKPRSDMFNLTNRRSVFYKGCTHMKTINGKERNEKIQKYLDAALDLFYDKGYEKTTINDIINKLGVSKGAFYHYFESKEDIIETIAVGYTEKMGYVIRDIVQRTDINALEKFNKSIEEAQAYKKQESDRRSKIKGSLRNEENLKLQKKILDKVSEEYIVFYDQIVKEGIEQQIFNIYYSKELPKFILKISHELNESIDELVLRIEDVNKGNKDFYEELSDKLSFYEDVFNRVLNIKEDTIKLKEPVMKRFN